MTLTPQILNWLEYHWQDHLQLLLTLAQIPAPSNEEQQRAQFCKEWLESRGALGVTIDEALNVLYPIGVGENNPLVVFAAHSDVVFPDRTPLPLETRDGKIFCPGIGDDSACVAALLTAASCIVENHLLPKDCGILLVINAGEEGLGNLKGTRKLFETYGSRIREFITFDDRNCRSVTQAVGSRRFRIRITTEGGHSYNAFGNANAIAQLSALITELYTQEVPSLGKTTYNVGTISGGTSVNTIAQEAQMLYEFRSDCREALEIMQQNLDAAIESCRKTGVQVTVTPVGDRPCSADVDPDKMESLKTRAADATRRYFDRELTFHSGSTDCNIPLSLGIPAICLGCFDGAGAHTREEYVTIGSLLPGLKFMFDMILHHFQ